MIKNKTSLLAVLSLTLISLSSALRAASETVIDCDFSVSGEKGLPQVMPETDKEKIPYKFPTGVGAVPPSTIAVKPNGEGSYKAPLAVFVIGPRAENPAAASSARINWDLRKAKLATKGIYELTYTIVPLKLPIFGGRMQFSLVDPEGVALADTVVHITTMPAVGFREDKFGTAMELRPVKEGKAYDVKIVLDLDKHRWSAWLDGKPLVKKMPLPETLTNAYPVVSLGGVSIGSEAGLADQTGGSYAIGGLKMVRTSAEAE
jgi:hypothetical protein